MDGIAFCLETLNFGANGYISSRLGYEQIAGTAQCIVLKTRQRQAQDAEAKPNDVWYAGYVDMTTSVADADAAARWRADRRASIKSSSVWETSARDTSLRPLT